MERIKQLEEDTKIAVTYVAYFIYLVACIVVFFASLSSLVHPLIGFMMLFISSVGLVFSAKTLVRNKERLRQWEIILPKKIRRRLRKVRQRMKSDDGDIFG